MNERLKADTSVLLLASCSQSAAAWVSELGGFGDSFVVATHQAGLASFFSESFDLIVVDTQGPTLTRAELALCRRLRKYTAKPILLLTEDTNESHLLRAYRMGIDDCIEKPIAIELLIAKASAWARFSAECPTLPYSGTYLPRH